MTVFYPGSSTRIGNSTWLDNKVYPNHSPVLHYHLPLNLDLNNDPAPRFAILSPGRHISRLSLTYIEVIPLLYIPTQWIQ